MFSYLGKVINFIKKRYAPRGAKVSFSGSGEDLIMSELLGGSNKKFSYIDIGAYDPIFGNNTYLFYKRGGRGVLVEPNDFICKKIKDKRPGDVCLNVGVGKSEENTDFYLFKRETRNTFSIKEKDAWEKISGEKADVQKKQLITLDKIIKDHFHGESPDIVSIDTEGYEMDILSGLSWDFRPKIFCIEVISSSGSENTDVYKIMKEHGYDFVARTSVNSIFVDSK